MVDYRNAIRFGLFERVLLFALLLIIISIMMTVVVTIIGEHGDPTASTGNAMEMAAWLLGGTAGALCFGRPLAAALYEGGRRVKHRVVAD